MLPIIKLSHEEFEKEKRKTNFIVTGYIVAVVISILSLLILNKLTSKEEFILTPEEMMEETVTAINERVTKYQGIMAGLDTSDFLVGQWVVVMPDGTLKGVDEEPEENCLCLGRVTKEGNITFAW